MEDFAKADIFFVVTTVGVALVSLGLLVFLVYCILIVADVRSFTKTLKEGGHTFVQHALRVPRAIEKRIKTAFSSKAKK